MIDLTRWNWTGSTGKPTSTQDLNKRKSNNDLVFNPDGSITFIARSGGAASTPNSSYVRSELRETLENGDDKEANWKLSSAPVHTLSARLRIGSLADSKKAIIGQFHGIGNKPPAKLQITDGTIYLQYRKKLNGDEKKQPVFKGYRIGDELRYELSVTDKGLLSIDVNGEQFEVQLDAGSYAKDAWYAKAGMYSQENAKTGKGTGRATFYEIVMEHGTKGTPAPKPEPKPEPGVSPAEAAVQALEEQLRLGSPPAQVKRLASRVEDQLDDLDEEGVEELRARVKAVRDRL